MNWQLVELDRKATWSCTCACFERQREQLVQRRQGLEERGKEELSAVSFHSNGSQVLAARAVLAMIQANREAEEDICVRAVRTGGDNKVNGGQDVDDDDDYDDGRTREPKNPVRFLVVQFRSAPVSGARTRPTLLGRA